MSINITGNPGTPDFGDPANFNTEAQAFFNWLMQDTAGGFIYQLENIDAADYFSVSAFMQTVLDDADASAARSTLGAQAQDDHLDDLAALTAVSAAGKIMMSSAAGTWAYEDLVGTVSQSGGTPTGAVFEKPVSSANGWVRKTADGFMECWHTLTMTYLSAQSLTATWTLPATFVEAPVPTNARGPTASTTPTNAEVQGAARIHSIDTTSITFQLSRIDGKTDFQSGDTITLYVSAKGRWSALT